ncbi:hypothetical protein HK104_004420, partial [Borealophlyctis nickersoniae]
AKYAPYFRLDGDAIQYAASHTPTPTTPRTRSSSVPPKSRRASPTPPSTSSPPPTRHKSMRIDLTTRHGVGVPVTPPSPGPVGVMGGVVPTAEQYGKLKSQMEVLMGALPEGLRSGLTAGVG